MEDITLEKLLEAGCHFGHKAERWYPKANEYIYTKKDGVHIIDLAKTKTGLESACTFIRETVTAGGQVLFVATKRQARGVVKEEAAKVSAPFFVERWIGGFLTNWDEIKKNIDKTNRMAQDQSTGAWKQYPKHEQVKLAQHLKRLQAYYGGVLLLKSPPQVLFVIDVRKEIAAVREAKRMQVPIVAVLDTNSDPRGITYVIPANDDAVGSIQLITRYICQAYEEGLKLREKKKVSDESGDKKKDVKSPLKSAEFSKKIEQSETDESNKEPKSESDKPKRQKSGSNEIPVRRGRPKKTI